MSEENVGCSFVSIHYIICECGETFPSEDALKIHLEKEHPHKRERKEYKCGICSNIYPTEDECIQHYEATHLPVNINFNQCEAEDSDEFEADKKSPQLCTEVTSELEEAEMPAEEVTLEDAIEAIKQETLEEGEIPLEPGEMPVLIEIPRAPAKKKGRKIIPKTEPDPELIFLIQEGQKKGEYVSMLKKSGRLPKGQRTIVCEVCGKYYASFAALRYHQRTHTGEKPYQCNMCPKSFTMPLFLQIHERCHTGERPYQCPDCPKAFSNKAALLRHQRVHTGEKPYKCPMCAKSFTQSNSMKVHVTTVHLKQPTPYKSKSRKHQAEERLQNRKKVFVNPRKKIAVNIDSVEVLKNGLESYVLGPLKADLENLKADIDMLARGELDEEIDGIQCDKDVVFEMRDNVLYGVKDNVAYEMKDNNVVYEVVEEVYEGECEVETSH